MGKKTEMAFVWFSLFQNGTLSEDQISQALEIEKIKISPRQFNSFAKNIDNSTAESFKEFLIDFGLMEEKEKTKSLPRINSIEKFNKLFEGGEVPISLAEYLELTNQIVEAQAKLNEKLRPMYELRIFLHRNKNN